jgi:hypothetical protein
MAEYPLGMWVFLGKLMNDLKPETGMHPKQ